MGEDGRESECEECGEKLIMMDLDIVVDGLLFRVFMDAYMLLCERRALTQNTSPLYIK